MRLASIHTYPVKGCHRIDQDAAAVQPWGLAGDRRFMPVDGRLTMVSQREVPRLTQVQPVVVDGGIILTAPGMTELKVPAVAADPATVTLWGTALRASLAGAAADEWLSAAAGHPLRLVYLDDPTQRAVNPRYGRQGDRVSLADGYPVLLTSTASLAALNDWIADSGSAEAPLPMTRFRPNVVISGAAAWAEDGWVGRRLRIGPVEFLAPKPSDRCVLTTNDQETGERGREPLRTLARHRTVDQKLLFGLNLIPDGTGEIAVGDPVELLDPP
jgi:MOSC domain-containing protein